MESTELANSPSQHTFSASPPLPDGAPPAQPNVAHKRTYQACLPCRRRKVRCDLGSVDEPGDPPCQRCRREKKDCVFSETRRKRKADDEGGDLTDDYVARNKRSSGIFVATDGQDNVADIAGPQDRASLLNGPSNGASGAGFEGQTRSAPSLPKRPDKAAANRDVTNETAAALFQDPIVQPADALHMLVDAASRSEIQEQKNVISLADRERLLAKQTHRLSTSGAKPEILSSAIDPAIMDMQYVQRTAAEADVNGALQAWSRLRFVQAGWFTAREAISYIDYFYEHLAPLTPISPPDFSNYAEHPRLLAEEPMLTVTLLTITSRYKKLTGPGGQTRSTRIHDQLWEYLQGMVTRMFWAQEQFGGGFCGAGNSKTQEEMDAKRRGLRSLGTAESLLLLSDWLPRSMHFPPGDDANELLVPLISGDETDDSQTISRIHAAWTEPAIRSDRMCWSVIGMAYTLSWELGVFDSLLEERMWSPGPQAKTVYGHERADRIGRMLLVYVSQACGRLGYPNMMPSQGNETNFNFLKMDIPEGTYPGPYGTISETDKIQRAWAELTALMRQSNTEMFESKKRVDQAIRDGSYMRFLEDWGPRMKEWKYKFDQTEMPEKAKIILQIEFEYTKTYINSMSLQAVVESAVEVPQGAVDSNENVSTKPTNANTPPALFSSRVNDVHKQNRLFIEELIESARNVLRLAVEGLDPLGALRHSPVRTHFRILSAAMFLLKSFAVGAKEHEVFKSLHLLEAAIEALRKSVIDDVHLSLRIADLLDGLTKKIRKKFVRLAVPSRGSKQRPSHAHRPSTSHPTSVPKSSSHDRRHSGNSVNRPTAPSQSSTIRNGTSTPPAIYPESFYTSLGLDDPPPLVNLKDSNITIMPPPDLNFANPDFNTGPMSPHASNAVSGGLASPTIGTMTNRPRNSSFDTSSQMQFSPAQASFSPMSTGSGGGSAGGYDWLTLDFNPLIANGIHFGPGEHSGMHSGQSHHGAQAQHQGHSHNQTSATGQMNDGMGGQVGDSDEGQGGVGASPWTMGAFGPEISEGLEMLGALGALWDDPAGSNPGSGQNWQV